MCKILNKFWSFSLFCPTFSLFLLTICFCRKYEFFVKINIGLVLDIQGHVRKAFVPGGVVGMIHIEYLYLAACLLLQKFEQFFLIVGDVFFLNLYFACCLGARMNPHLSPGINIHIMSKLIVNILQLQLELNKLATIIKRIGVNEAHSDCICAQINS